MFPSSSSLSPRMSQDNLAYEAAVSRSSDITMPVRPAAPITIGKDASALGPVLAVQPMGLASSPRASSAQNQQCRFAGSHPITSSVSKMVVN